MTDKAKLISLGLQEWHNENEPSKSMYHYDTFYTQFFFVRDNTQEILLEIGFTDFKINPLVISTHISKSILLPVYQVVLPKGVTMTLRCNFHDWKISVDSGLEINTYFFKLFDDTQIHQACHCEGFSENLIFGSYENSKKKFTIELRSGSNHIYMFMRTLISYLYYYPS